MNLIPMTKLEAQAAEKVTTPISNLSFNFPNKPTAEHKKLQKAVPEMFNWQYTKTNQQRKGLETTKEKKDHISKHLGKPLYHTQYEYREAVWGFKINEVKVIIYYSTKGFSIQMSKDCSAKEAHVILIYICKKLEE